MFAPGPTKLSLRHDGDTTAGKSSALVSAIDPLGTQPFRPSLVLTFRGHRSTVLAAGFQPSAPPLTERPGGMSDVTPPYAFSCGADGCVFLWSAKPTVRALRFVGHRGPVHDCAWSPHAHLIASAGHDGFVRLWLPSLRRSGGMTAPSTRNIAGENCCLWRAHAGPVRALALAPHDDCLYTAGDDKAVKCWDLNYASSTLVGKGGGIRFVSGFTGGHQNWVRTVAVSGGNGSDGRLLPTRVSLVASGSDDRTVQVWDTRSRRPTHTFFEHTAAVRSVDFHPDGCSIATGSADHTINVFDLRKNQLLQHYDAHDGAVNEVRFAPTGSWLLSASADGAVKLWDLKEGYLYCTLSAHKGAVHTARFSDDGACFTTAGQDNIVMVWRSGLLRVPPSYSNYPNVHLNEAANMEMRMRSSERPLSPPPPAAAAAATKTAKIKTTGALTESIPQPSPKRLRSFFATAPRADGGQSRANSGRTQVTPSNDFYCSIETSGNCCFDSLPEGARTEHQLEGNMSSSTISSPSAILQKPPLAQPSSRTTAVAVPSSFSLPDDDYDAKENLRKVADRYREPPSRRCSGNDLRGQLTFAREHKDRKCSFLEQPRFLPVDGENNKAKKTGSGVEGGENCQLPNDAETTFIEFHEHCDDGTAVESGGIDDEMSVLEYVGKTCDVGDGEYFSDGLTLQPDRMLSSPTSEKGEHRQHTVNRISRLEEACARLTAEVQVAQERSADVVLQLQKQWETQQLHQQKEMDQLRQMMEGLAVQQSALLQALRKE